MKKLVLILSVLVLSLCFFSGSVFAQGTPTDHNLERTKELLEEYLRDRGDISELKNYFSETGADSAELQEHLTKIQAEVIDINTRGGKLLEKKGDLLKKQSEGKLTEEDVKDLLELEELEKNPLFGLPDLFIKEARQEIGRHLSEIAEELLPFGQPGSKAPGGGIGEAIIPLDEKEGGEKIKLPHGDIQADWLPWTIKTILGIMGIVTLVIFAYAGIKLIIEGDVEEERTKAKRMLLYCIIGLAIMIFSYAIISNVLHLLD